MGYSVAAQEVSGSVDFGIITMRDDEFRAVLRFFGVGIECKGRRTYDIVNLQSVDDQTYRAAIVRTMEQGHGAAQATASDLIADLAPAWLVLVGIGGAVPETEFSLGDVLLGSRVHDLSLTAAMAGGQVEYDIRGGPAHKAVQDLISRIAAFEHRLGAWNAPATLGLARPGVELDPAYFKGDEAWRRRVEQAIQANFGTPELAARAPRATSAAMASGNLLMKDPALLERWLESARSIKAVEMELPGVFEAARSAQGDVPVLAVRGISDVVGFRRDPHWTAYACATAASFAFALLRHGPFPPRPKQALVVSGAGGDQSPALRAHLERLANWSAEIKFAMMPSPRDVQSQTIALNFTGMPRKFTRSRQGDSILDESAIMASARHALILGRPGAGKTTTVKRLCRVALQTMNQPEGRSRTPLLVRLRECNAASEQPRPVLVALARELGLSPSLERITLPVPEEAGQPPRTQVVLQTMCGSQRVEIAVPRALVALDAVVFLDGLDEVNPSMRSRVEADIRELMEASDVYRVVVTCRTGERVSDLGLCHTYEVCDLDDADIDTLARAWLGGEAEAFLESLRHDALQDLARRPLFLAHLMNLFHVDGQLPTQPFDIYGRITELCLTAWDRERDITRVSRYSGFGSHRKFQFLSAFAFDLTYTGKSKIFTERELVSIYQRLRHKFQLPEEEATLVAEEIESHTGIVVEVGFKTYEFSHLTIQEYLAAEWLVRLPFPGNRIAALLQQQPDPLAIAVVLSSDPAQWLAGVLMNEGVIQSGFGGRLIPFLNRLQQENPIFVGGEGLGLCIIGLCFQAGEASEPHQRHAIEKHLDLLLQHDAARRSFADVATQRYALILQPGQDAHFVATSRGRGEATNDLSPDIDLPATARVSRRWLEENFLGRELMFNGMNVVRRR